MDFLSDIQVFSQKYFQREIRPHQVRWLQHFEDNSWSLLLAPRGHGKSTMMITYVCWKICTDHDVRLLIASHKEQEANVFMRNIQMFFERPDVQEDFDIQPGKPWRVGFSWFEGKRQPTLRTVASEAGITGARFDIAVFDDLLTEKNQQTEKRRQQIESWIWSEVLPALDPGPKQKIIVVGTRKHLQDWYSKIMEMEDFKVLLDRIYTVDRDGRREYLWPERFTPEEVEKLRRNWPADKFAREFMNSPVVDEGLHFKREWIEKTYYSNLPPLEWLEFYIGVDPNMGSTKERSSYFALAVIAHDTRPNNDMIYVVDMVRKKCALTDALEIIREKTLEWHPVSANIESCMANKAFAEQVIREIENFHPVVYRGNDGSTGLRGTSDIAKIGRIENIVGYLFRYGMLRLRDPRLCPMTKLFIDAEYCQFPEGDMDLLDALNMAVDLVDMRTACTELPLYTF